MYATSVIELGGIIFTSVMASTGFWALIKTRSSKKSAQDRLLLGLANQQMITAAEEYINRGYIDIDEYHNFMDYLWIPYKELGGNGLGAKLAMEIQRLPIKGDTAYERAKEINDN